MIPIDALETLKPGRKLYRVLATQKKDKPIMYRVAIAHVDRVTPKNVIFIENTDATSHGKRQTTEWVSENMALSRQGAWDQAAAHMLKRCEDNEYELGRLTAAGIILAGEYQVIKRKGRR